MRNQGTNQSMRKILWWAIPIVVLLVIYIGGAIHYQNKFLPKTEIFGIKIAGKTTTQANSTLKDNIKTTKYTFKDGSKTVTTATGAEIGMSKDFGGMLTTVKNSQNAWSWPIHLFTKPTASLSKATAIINDDTLNQFSTTTAAKLNKNRVAPRDAALSFKNGKLVTTKEHKGNLISATKLTSTIKKSVLADQNTVNLKKTYVTPQVTTNMKSFKNLKTKLTKIANVSGTFKIENKEVKVSKAEVQSWIDIKGTTMTISKSKIDNYLTSIDHKYGTYYKTRYFKSTASGTVDVPAGIYGWTVNHTKEIPVLVSAVKAGKTFHKDIIHKGMGYHADGSDIGNTYIEVDKQNQMEYYYKDGKMVMSSAVDTGNPNKGHATPSGVFDVWSKQRNATLKGQGYSQPVSYWMPINDTGVGLHDSPWQPQYGGSWYLSHGSHGCVNNPPAFIAKLYPQVALGTPVVVF